jgi:Flp pilus assembly protein TadG
MGLAAVAMVGMIALLAYVVDAGMFFMIRRELQNTADAAALAGAAFLEPLSTNEPLSVRTVPSPLSAQCTAVVGLITDSDPPTQALKRDAGAAACYYGTQNAAGARKLCEQAVIMDTPGFTTWPGHSSPAIVVNFHCVAGYSFGRIVGLSNRTISAGSTAAIGLRTVTLAGVVLPAVDDFVINFDYTGFRRATRLVNN